MPQWTFSTRSLARLEGVHEALVKVTHKALDVSAQDFGVICGPRSIEQQRELVRIGNSHTLKSKHLLDPAEAVDVLAYNGPDGSWHPADYYPVADAFAEAADELGVEVIWGGCWTFLTTATTAREQNARYAERCRKARRSPFNDLGHFELGAAL